MTARTLTKAQERALAWLPADGGWSEPVKDNSKLGVSLWVLSRPSPGLVDRDPVAQRGWRFRLRGAGIALKAGRGVA